MEDETTMTNNIHVKHHFMMGLTSEVVTNFQIDTIVSSENSGVMDTETLDYARGFFARDHVSCIQKEGCTFVQL